MSTPRRHPNVINVDEVSPMPMNKGRHRLELRRLGSQTGTQMLGATRTELPPGAVSFPFHYHCAAEEAIFVLAGSGTARIGDAKVAVRAGDFIAYPVGPEHAHQMINDSDAPLVYLSLSAHAQKIDVVGYPDSKKVAATAGPYDKPIHRFITRMGESLDYWDGEPEAQS